MQLSLIFPFIRQKGALRINQQVKTFIMELFITFETFSKIFSKFSLQVSFHQSHGLKDVRKPPMHKEQKWSFMALAKGLDLKQIADAITASQSSLRRIILIVHMLMQIIITKKSVHMVTYANLSSHSMCIVPSQSAECRGTYCHMTACQAYLSPTKY